MKTRRTYYLFIGILAVVILAFIFNPFSKKDSTLCLENEGAQGETIAKYNVKADKLDIDAVNSFPQRIEKTISDNEGSYEVDMTIESNNDRFKSVKLDKYDYNEEVKKYIKPSAKIESDSKIIKDLAESIVGDETDILEIAQKTAEWTANNIEFDNDLAQRIWGGTVDTQGAIETIERRMGTCSEYTNVFIAIMRNKGIPARFVSGFMYEGVYHAWAEIYLYDVGWIPVEPQGGNIGTSERHIKLFTGKDFVDIGVKLKEINIRVKKLD